ncbi:MAG TPA: nitronate monooxygenase [Candidatus Binataceae bacterium]|nr:nitronate monooxygenase [Candidatus Binataceae bacterium]
MRTALTEMFGIEAPIFAFSHCRDVVVEVSKAGGIGVLGATRFNPKQLETELAWIDQHIGGRPYGVDVLIPQKSRTSAPSASTESPPSDSTAPFKNLTIPKETIEWLEGIMRRYDVPPLPSEQKDLAERRQARHAAQSPRSHAGELIEVALQHPLKLLVSALGPPPAEFVTRAHSMGARVCGLVGKPEHATKQREAGVDFVVATGTEAGGHTGYISTMVLVPQIVDVVSPLPVVAAGGIANGRQMAAALALGAEGVWCGSVWLTSAQSEVSPQLKERLLKAKSEDAILSKVWSGKNCRILRSKFTEAWDEPGAPATLDYPAQNALKDQYMQRIERYGKEELLSYPIGQVVGQLKQETTVRQIFYEILSEFADTAVRFSSLSAR